MGCLRRRLFGLAPLFVTVSVLLTAQPALSEQWQSPLPAGNHHASLTSSQGAGSDAVTDSGAVAVAVPLDLPQPRGGLPLPVSIRYVGGNVVGAAGAGFSVPISYVVREDSVGRHKPRFLPEGAAPADIKPVPRVFLAIEGARTLMNYTGAEPIYRPLVASEYSTLLGPMAIGGTPEMAWKLNDAAGRTWWFEKLAELGDDSLWLLTEIRDPNNNRIAFTYNVLTPTPGTTELQLAKVSYSFSAMGSGCAQHEVLFAYAEPPWSAPGTVLGLSVDRGHVSVRTQVLESITVQVNDVSCAVAGEASRLDFSYEQDADTGAPRLTDVIRRGATGWTTATDGPESLPVSSFGFGATTTPGMGFKLYPSDAITLPSAAYFGSQFETASGSTPGADSCDDGSPSRSDGVRLLADFSGDGRPDLVYGSGAEPGSTLSIAANNATSPFSSSTALFADPSLSLNVTSSQTSVFRHYDGTCTQSVFTSTWVAVVDWNGDGRLDFVDAKGGRDPASGKESRDFWRVLLNVQAPGQPQQWKARMVDIRPLRAALQAAGHKDVRDDEPLPVSRAQSGGEMDTMGCWYDVIMTDTTDGGRTGAAYACDGVTLCDGSDPSCFGPTIKQPAQMNVEWKLQDMNGDGFPDLVYNGRPLVDYVYDGCWADACYGLTNPEAYCNSYGCMCMDTATASCVYWGDGVTECRNRWTCETTMALAGSTSNQILVLYNGNGGGLVAASDARDFDVPTSPISLGQSWCGVESYWRDGDQRWLRCGFREVNGDGLPDRIEEVGGGNSLSTGLPDPYTVYVSVNTGAGFYGTEDLGFSVSFKGAFTLPDHAELMQDGAVSVCKGASGSTLHDSRTLKLLLDLTGDGIPDYIERADAGGTVRIGSGMAFGPPIAITATHDAFEISHQVERCDGKSSTTVAGLIDLDGDSRPELLSSQTIGGPWLRVARLVDDHFGPLPVHGGRLVSLTNGYGATTTFGYTSAKWDEATPHQVPFPEIVVQNIKTTTAKGLGPSLDPVFFAYGDAWQVYNPLLARWHFAGYGRRVEVRPDPSAPYDMFATGGVAVITDALRPQDLAAGVEKYALLGRIKAVQRLVGVGADPAMLLGVNVASDTRWKSAVTPTFTYRNTNLGATSTEAECADVDAYAPGPPASSTDEAKNLCRATVVAYAQQTDAWAGEAPPPSTNPCSAAAPNDRFVKARTRIVKVDWYGRPVQLRMDNDVCRTDDDVCIEVTYTTSSFVLDAVASRRTYDCAPNGGVGVTLAKVDRYYDGLPALGLTQGLLTREVVERHNTSSGAVEGSSTMEMGYGEFGQIAKVTLSRADGVSRVTSIDYDNFENLPTYIRESASDATVALEQYINYDPVLLAPTSVVDENLIIAATTYDRYGRERLSTITDPRDKQTYVLADRRYLGDDPSDPEGRRVAERSFADWVASARYVSGGPLPTGGREAITFFDELGRSRFTESALGADYAGKSLVIGQTTYDSRGRPKFRAAPYVKGETSLGLYGSSFHYDVAGRTRCVVDAVNWTESETPDAAHDTYPHCWSYLFAKHEAVARLQGPNELRARTPQTGAFDELRASAIGRTLAESRNNAAGTRLSATEYSYDRLGQRTSIRRLTTPATSTAAVVWNTVWSSAGWPLIHQEPNASAVTMTYDEWGDLVEASWADASVSPSVVRGMAAVYDGFGRIKHVEAQANGAADPAFPSYQYFYDQPSTDPRRAPPFNMSGRLAWATDGEITSWLSYDTLGRPAVMHQLDGIDALLVKQASDLGPDGHLRALHFDTPEGVEHVSYSLDSANRVKLITVFDKGGTKPVFTATGVDALGRYTGFTLGNGVEETRTYRSDRRRELLSRLVSSPSISWVQDYLGYDGEGRLTKTRDHMSSLSPVPAPIRTSSYAYDALNRLSRATQTLTYDEPGFEDVVVTALDERYTYDALGSLSSLTDSVGSGSLVIERDVADPDRVCQVYAPGAPGTACSYRYDLQGEVTSAPDADGDARFFSYDPSGRMVRVNEATATATLRYGAFGEVTDLVVTGAGAGDRSERQYGPLLGSARFPGIGKRLIERRIPGPMGLLQVRRGSGAGLVAYYPHFDDLGLRAVTNAAGAQTETMNYRPYGSLLAGSATVPEDNAGFERAGFNGGEALKPFGLVWLGARAYDPRTGRFMQRDPIVARGHASRQNPYTFAFADPVNYADPTGLSGEGPIDCGPDGCGDPIVIPGWSFNPEGGDTRLGDGYGYGAYSRPYDTAEYVGLLNQLGVVGSTNLTTFEVRLASGDSSHWPGSDFNTSDLRGIVTDGGGEIIGYVLGFDGYTHAFDRMGNDLGKLSDSPGIESEESPIDWVLVPAAAGWIVGAGRAVATRVVSKVGKTAAKELGEELGERATGRVASRINLANGATRFTPLRASGQPVSAGWNHVLAGHFGRAVGNNRSVFTITQTEVRAVLQSPAVVGSPVFKVGNQFVRVVDVGRVIGTSSLNRGGGPTSVIKVFTDEAGNLITAFPW